MSTRTIAVDPFDIVVFGASGDLSRRKLLPALFERDRVGQIPDEARIIGVSRSHMDDAAFRDVARQAAADAAHGEMLDAADLQRFCARISYVALDVGDGDEDWAKLKGKLDEAEGRIRVFYLATAPDLFATISRGLGAHGLVTPESRVVVEKPVGRDLDSARAVNDAIGEVFSERQIYRIDHYLGKETVQNLMVLRFANTLFEPLWNAAHVDHVQITVAESIGLEGRAGYYDHSGALRDMVQNHMLQVLCLVAMEMPVAIDADSVRDEKLKVLRGLKPVTDENVKHMTVRGQYRAGATGAGAVRGYADELGKPASDTETFVAIKAEIGNWRWANVPFYLRTGKRLPQRVSEVVVYFRPVPHSVFGPSVGPIEANRLVVRLQPDEGVKLWLVIKDPGPGGMRLKHVPLDMSFAKAFGVRNPEAYERLIMDVVRGNQTLFMRRDEVEAAWAWIDPILRAWRNLGEPPKPYTAGTWGPSAAIGLIERDGRSWHDDDD